MMLNKIGLRTFAWSQTRHPFGGLPPGRYHDIRVGHVVIRHRPEAVEQVMVNFCAVKMRLPAITFSAGPRDQGAQPLPQTHRRGWRRNDCNFMAVFTKFVCINRE